MLKQVRIEFPEGSSAKDKGDLLEDLMRSVLERQRYVVTQRIRFVGTEIDLLCKHKDRRDDTALAECKARLNIVADDLKNFAYDLLVAKKARHGYFVHTTELQQNAAGVADELIGANGDQVTLIGPEKLMDLLAESGLIASPPSLPSTGLTPTKLILLYTPDFKAWIQVLAAGAAPSHFAICSAIGRILEPADESLARKYLADELQDLEKLAWAQSAAQVVTTREPEAVALVQESTEWTDLRPVGAKYFVGRDKLTAELYRFVRAPLEDTDAPRVFFIEGKSGWGKSSIIAHLRARARNKRNKNSFFVQAIDSRSANTSAFVGAALQSLLTAAAQAEFIPRDRAESIRFPSWFDLLADPKFGELFSWLRERDRMLVLVFDQFEDVFRKTELFRAFHKLMLDATARSENLLLGFSWKSEISIPMDNPAYSLWQQARETATAFSIEKFGAGEVEKVITQLQQQSGKQIPPPLRRRLRESSQGFPWLTKKLATHCFFELRKGLTPDELIDQDLNVRALFDRDRDQLTPEETRGLKVIAKRAYDGDAFDVSEVDETVPEAVVDRLLAKRLIVRTGGKYSVYWDIFRDYLVEGTPPRLEDSFLLRQYPSPCTQALAVILSRSRTRVIDIQAALGVTEGTALNLLRELRNVGAVTKKSDRYLARQDVVSDDAFRLFMKKRLESHLLSRALRKKPGQILQSDVTAALRIGYSSFAFEDKTWDVYADFFIAWSRYCQTNIASRLAMDSGRRGSGRKGDELLYTPQCRPEQVVKFLNTLPRDGRRIRRPKEQSKALYDLKALGLVEYAPSEVALTPAGKKALGPSQRHTRAAVAQLALGKPKIAQAVRAERAAMADDSVAFEDGIKGLLQELSPSYQTVTRHVLRSWARFVIESLPTTPPAAQQGVAADGRRRVRSPARR